MAHELDRTDDIPGPRRRGRKDETYVVLTLQRCDRDLQTLTIVARGNITSVHIGPINEGFFNNRAKATLYVSNLFNRVGEIPYYSGGFEYISVLNGANYNGREWSLQLQYKID